MSSGTVSQAMERGYILLVPPDDVPKETAVESLSPSQQEALKTSAEERGTDIPHERRKDTKLYESLKHHYFLHGYTFQNKNLFPIYNHEKDMLFRHTMISSMTDFSTVETSLVQKVFIRGKTQDEFEEDFGRKLSVQLGVDAKVITPVAKAEFKGQSNVTSRRKNKFATSFSQERIQVTKQFTRLRLFSITTKGSLELFLCDEASKELLKCSQPQKAALFLERFGHYYISHAHFGGLRTYETKDIMAAQDKSLSRSASAEGSLFEKCSLICSKTRNQNYAATEDNTKEVGFTSGGEINASNDANKWINSIEDGNYDISQCSFQPIYKLIGTDAESPLDVCRKMLKQAHYSMLGLSEQEEDEKIPICSSHQYLIKNYAYDKYCIRPKQEKDGMFPTKFSPRQGLINNKNLVFTVLQNYKSYNKEGMNISLQPTHPSTQFLSRKRIFSGVLAGKAPLQLSSASDRSDRSNQWCLRRDISMGKKCFYILTPCRKYMLGVKRVGKSLSESDLKLNFTFQRFKAQDKEIDHNFIWIFHSDKEKKRQGRATEEHVDKSCQLIKKKIEKTKDNIDTVKSVLEFLREEQKTKKDETKREVD